jgi:drug/metabolite transporter (DMT)-like permease
MNAGGGALLALASAVLWGGGDFCGGMGVKTAGGGVRAALRVVLLSHVSSFSVLLAVARLRGDAFPHGTLLAWGLGAGVAAGISLTCFYMALSRGAMGAPAAVSGLLAAAIPAALTVSVEGSPGVGRLVGFAVAGWAIWLIAAGPADARQTAGAGTAWLAVTAGAGFGIYFVSLKMAGPAGVIWPMATARIGSLGVCLLMLLGLAVHRSEAPGEARERLGPQGLSKKAVGWALATALLDSSGNLLFVAATRAGRLDVAAVLASLYPASTILLAAGVLGERVTRRQGLGMAVAVAAVGLIVL